MRILSVNYKTVGSLLKKSVKDFWLDDNKDAWFQFTDGSTVCIHILEEHWDTYMSVDKNEDINCVSFNDEQSITVYQYKGGKEHMYTSRTVSLYFDNARYYYHRNFNYVTHQYIPVIEFHYYENGEENAGDN